MLLFVVLIMVVLALMAAVLEIVYFLGERGYFDKPHKPTAKVKRSG